MNLKVRLLLMVAGLLGAYAFATWAWVFYRIVSYGEIRLIEPVRWIVISEFIMAIVFGTICLVAYVAAFRAKEYETS